MMFGAQGTEGELSARATAVPKQPFSSMRSLRGRGTPGL